MNWCVDAGRIGGRRIRRRFPTQEQAEMWVKENESIREIEGLKTMGLWARMTENERGSLVRALELLRPELSPVNFEEIARAYLAFTRPGGGRKTIPEAVEAFILRKKRDNKKESYRIRLKRDLLAFSRDLLPWKRNGSCERLRPILGGNWCRSWLWAFLRAYEPANCSIFALKTSSSSESSSSSAPIKPRRGRAGSSTSFPRTC